MPLIGFDVVKRLCAIEIDWIRHFSRSQLFLIFGSKTKISSLWCVGSERMETTDFAMFIKLWLYTFEFFCVLLSKSFFLAKTLSLVLRSVPIDAQNAFIVAPGRLSLILSFFFGGRDQSRIKHPIVFTK